jgi:POTRA domain, FtsQ-type
MSKRQASKPRRSSRPQVLEVRVMSPRIAWFSFLKVLGSLTKIACMAAVVVGIGWGVWQGIQRAFYQNPDFRLQVIDLNSNSIIDEYGLVEATGIDLTASLFEINVDDIAAKLKQQPGISDASAERHLPGKLVVRVVTRTPRAWISHSESDPSEIRQVSGMLVDENSIAYPCPERQLESALNLPIIHLPVSDEFPMVAGQKMNSPELAHCIRLLDSANEADVESIQWIESIKQVNEWSLELVTRQGTTATFGMGDHGRQMHRLRAAIDHSGQKGYDICTINLIPKQNIPITVRSESPAPRKVIVTEPGPEQIRENRRTRDLNSLLNRN